jgi:hypothetical protein
MRELALALPQVEEVEHMGAPSFRVAGKIFAQLSADETVAIVKLSLLEQEDLLRRCPDRASVPPHWAKFGWTYLRIDPANAAELRTILQISWRLIAPKKLATESQAAT